MNEQIAYAIRPESDIQTMKTILPAGFVLRRPTYDDLPALTDLACASDIATQGELDTTREDIRSDLETTNLEQDAWVILAPGELVVAYASVSSNNLGKFSGHITVRPDYQRQGLGTSLYTLIEARASQRMSEVAADARISLNGSIYHGDSAALRFVEQLGMTRIRSFWRMAIDMSAPPPEPQWPAGLTVRLFVPGQDERAVYEADEEAFQDHWGHSPTPYDEWLTWTVQRADFDPSLWFLAMDAQQIAGAALCWAMPTLGQNGLGWVGQLWVRRPWRKQGLGLALLHHAFADLYRRGYRRVALGVDSESLTGATRLYERAGMRAIHQWDTYQQELRSGVEYTTLTLVEGGQ